MLFCSSVATEGSVMPATLAVAAESSGLKAAAGCCRREPQRSKHATLTAAKTAESIATAMICRAEILYMALLSDDFISFSKIGCKSDAAGRVRRCAFGASARSLRRRAFKVDDSTTIRPRHGFKRVQTT